jgi:hypothetical protein
MSVFVLPIRSSLSLNLVCAINSQVVGSFRLNKFIRSRFATSTFRYFEAFNTAARYRLWSMSGLFMFQLPSSSDFAMIKPFITASRYFRLSNSLLSFKIDQR